MLEIRCYVDDDLDEVVTLWYRSWTNAFPHLKHPQSFEEWKLRFQNDIAKRGNVWVAQSQSRIVGFIVITEAVGIIEQIFVDVDIQRMGVGTALHGLNAVYLPEVGWYRVDARGNRQGVNAQFTPPLEQLAFKIQFPEEADFQDIFPEPLRVVVEALQAHSTWNDLLSHLPDVISIIGRDSTLTT